MLPHPAVAERVDQVLAAAGGGVGHGGYLFASDSDSRLLASTAATQR